MKFSRDSVRTSGVGDAETTDLDRRSQDGTRLNGKVVEADYERKPPAYRIGFGDPNDEDNYILSDWLTAGGGRAKGDVTTHFLEVGETVSVHSEGGELSTGHVYPSGVYNDKDEDKKPGTNKAGVMHYKSKNGQEISFDRETGAHVIKCVGEKKDDDQGSEDGQGGGAPTIAATSDEGGGSENKKIKGSHTVEAGGGTLVMKDDKCIVTFGKSIMTFSEEGLVVRAGGLTFKFTADGFIQTGGKQEHDGKNVGKDHKHGQVQTGGSKTGDPE